MPQYKTARIRFCGVDYFAVPQTSKFDTCSGCAFNDETYDLDCSIAKPTCASDRSIYVITEQTVANLVAQHLTGKQLA